MKRINDDLPITYSSEFECEFEDMENAYYIEGYIHQTDIEGFSKSIMELYSSETSKINIYLDVKTIKNLLIQISEDDLIEHIFDFIGEDIKAKYIRDLGF